MAEITAKLVNDLLPQRIESPFWGDAGRHNYFDGCLRNDEARRARQVGQQRGKGFLELECHGQRIVHHHVGERISCLHRG